MKFIELGGYVSFFFLSNFLQKKVKLSENLEKQFQKMHRGYSQNFFLKYFTVDFFFNNTQHFLEHTRLK